MKETHSSNHPEVESESTAAESLVAVGTGERVARSVPSSVLLLAIISALLMIALIYLNLKGGKAGDSSPSRADLISLEAQATALKTQLNQQRLSMGLQPLSDGHESVENIASRLKKDADTMVGLTNSFQLMLAEKDAELSSQAGKLLQSEQVRQALALEIARLKGETQSLRVAGGGQDSLLAELQQLKQQRDALQAELQESKVQQSQSGDVTELQRRLEETTRAKEFFEGKVKQLESAAPKAEP